MSIDLFFNRVYNKSKYNCAHLVAEVWQHLTGEDIHELLAGFLLPPRDRYVKNGIQHNFEKLKNPVSPCLVLMRKPKLAPHVGLFYQGRVLHIHEAGVQFQPLDKATRGFTKLSFYRC
jgi:hypothetical protein